MNASIVIVGGGPAGSAAGALLASWGHRVLILDNGGVRPHALAESLPPSTSRLLAEIGILAAVEGADVIRSTGNTVWWGSTGPRVEFFKSRQSTTPADPAPCGFQIYRPAFDCVLRAGAAAAGATVRTNAQVRAVTLDTDGAHVAFEHSGRAHTVCARFVLDCSGRLGVIGRRFRRADQRLYALVGAWDLPAGDWPLPDPTHTSVEAYDTGWAWSIPVSRSVRQVGVMVDDLSHLAPGSGGLTGAYRREIARTRAMTRLTSQATLQRVWACDASTYTSSTYGGPGFLLVGDAGSAIDPLSSYGVKKALASAWLAAIVVNTSLAHPERQGAAIEHFTAWERETVTEPARHSADFAREAYAWHRTRFWERRVVDEQLRSGMQDERRAQRAALASIKERDELDLRLADVIPLQSQTVIRGREILVEEAFPEGLRFHEHVDLVNLARLAAAHRQVSDLFDAYCRLNAPVPLPNVLSGLSLLLAKGILQRRSAIAC